MPKVFKGLFSRIVEEGCNMCNNTVGNSVYVNIWEICKEFFVEYTVTVMNLNAWFGWL